jgi:hypothetical protein
VVRGAEAQPDQRMEREGEMIEWQPIETAPKDGEDVLVLLNMATVPVVHIARWETGEDADWPQGWWSYPLHSVTQELLDGYRSPVAWMPLPSTKEFV